ncbi:hypothetical protein EIP91_012303 [Steccherinum ochraceum]|uniref:Amidohydrolase-related domain-containing protein n=1 Tax=Steccherinum ochraceum TaxID=92696 RepID=A0A4R0RUQ5_9APHY|nr:hypothetical protein EIP91_012303 [Steccherinum ochraceum]
MSSKLLFESSTTDGGLGTRRRTTTRSTLFAFCSLVAGLTLFACNYYVSTPTIDNSSRIQHIPFNAEHILSQCASLKATVGPPESFSSRNVSDRFEPGTNSTLIRNANIWTGARNGTETVLGDVLLENGIVRSIGYIPDDLVVKAHNLTVVDAGGAWLTPGLVDLHSHVGLISAPFMKFEVNSPNGPILPWLRSIDGLHTHDEAFELAIAGGVTTVQVLPGSSNAIGGQAFMVKLRKTRERSPTSMLLEPPHQLNGSEPDSDEPLRWRHLKQACGENLDKYGTRMDSMWAFRSAYDTARNIMRDQDDYCAKAEAGLWNELSGKDYPGSLQWEALVDVLRGRVKIANHCYEEVDIDDIARLSNEFQFHIASIHHASEAWLIPGVLKRMFGGPPAVAVFASNHRYKRESYRGSEFGPRVLADNGIAVVMKSDHPVINSRHLIYEAQQAHYYGLPSHLALASVTSTPAHAAGMTHRIGSLVEGVDADVVLWDSHPLQLGATPRQVWIDGIPQLTNPSSPSSILVGKPKSFKNAQDIPRVPNWDRERKEAIQHEGLPPLGPKKSEKGPILLKNVRQVWVREERGLKERWSARPGQDGGAVVLQGGSITCVGKEEWCLTTLSEDDLKKRIVADLHGGSVGPAFLTFGSPLGIDEIDSEPSTGNGPLHNPFVKDVPKIVGDPAGLIRASDALQFQTRNALIAHRGGVSYATSSFGKVNILMGSQSPIFGLAATFRTGAAHALDTNAIVKEITALHISIGHAAPLNFGSEPVSVGTQIAAFRRLLLDAEDSDTDTGTWFQNAAMGSVPLVIQVNSADVMATLIKLKADVEEQRGSHMRWVFAGASEAHLLAHEIAQAKIGVILTSPRPFPGPWDSRRILAGPPITNDTAISVLMRNGVTVALGAQEAWQPVHTRFDAGWIAREADCRISEEQTYELVTTNLEKLLDMEGWFGEDGDLVVYDGGSPFDFESKIIAVASPRRGVVELF